MRHPPEPLAPYLAELPLYRVLIRAQEARLLRGYGPLPRPLLDLGCGDGHFASMLWREVEIGVDQSPAMLARAARRGIYRHLVRADARRLPLPASSVATVVSNCVIEHIPDLRLALQELFRVLRPGGRFYFTVPTPRLNAHLAGTLLLHRFGRPGLARRYGSWFAWLQRHFHMYDEAGWQALIEGAGFRVRAREGYLSPRAARIFDLIHFYEAPNLIARVASGGRLPRLWRWPRLEARLLAPLVAEPPTPDGTCLFFVAEK